MQQQLDLQRQPEPMLAFSDSDISDTSFSEQDV
jgi:hypothetical protein